MRKTKRKRRNNKRFASVGSVVRYLRVRSGLSQTELSKRCGGKVRPNDVSKIERGSFGVQIIKLVFIANYFGITVHAIVKNDFLAARSAITDCCGSPREKAKNKRKMINAKKDAAGAFGESLVVAMEKERLIGSGFEELVSGDYADDENAGFDIMSFTETGDPLFLEVKSSVGEDNLFYISANELAFANYCLKYGKHYYLIHFNCVFDRKKRSYKKYTAEELVHMNMKAQVYLVKED